MTKRLLQYSFLILFLFTGISVFAQSHQFQWVNGSGSEDGQVLSVAYSPSGDFVYAGGRLVGGGGAYIPTSVGGSDFQNGYLAKYSSSGTPIWAFNVGDNGTDEISAIAVDNSGNIIVAGHFEGSNVDFSGTSGGSANLTSTGLKDVFLAKYDPSGLLLWLYQGTSSGNDYANDLAVDGSGNIYLAGSSTGLFSYGGNAITSNGSQEAYALKVNSLGVFQWIRSAGTSNVDEFTSVTVFSGKAYFGGYYRGAGLGILGGLFTFLNLSPGTSEMMLIAYDAASGSSVYVTTFGGSSNDEIHGLANDGVNMYLSGFTQGTLSFGSDNFSNSSKEIIWAKLSPTLSPTWQFTTTHSSAGTANGWDIKSIGNNKIVIGGDYSGTLNTGYAATTNSTADAGLLLVCNASTGAINDQTVISGTSGYIRSVRTISPKNDYEIFTGGYFRSNTTFPPISVAGSNGFNHPFVAKYGCTPATATISGTTSICSGQTTNLTINFTGTGPFNIVINDGSTLYPISGLAGPTYTYPVAPTTTKTYTLSSFTSGSCSSTTSGSAVVTVISTVANNVIFGDTTHCGNSASSFTGTVPIGNGTGSISYLWQYNQGIGWFSAINPNNLQNYNSVSVSTNTQYRRRATIAGCPAHFSNVVVATIVPTLSGNTMPSNAQYCGPTDPAVFNAGSPSGGNSTYSYIWQEDDNGGFSSPSQVATVANYNASTLSQTTYFRRIVNSSVCADTSANLTITIEPVLGNNNISSDQTICGPNTASMLTGTTPTGGNGSYGYGWQSSTDSTNWNDLGGSQNYSPGLVSVTTWFRRLTVSGTCLSPDTSNLVKITVQQIISNNSISADEMLCQGDAPATINGLLPTGGAGAGSYNYVWRFSTDGISYSNVGPPVNNINYTPSTQPNTVYYKRVVISGVCPNDTSSAVEKLVYPTISNNNIFTPQTICENTAPSLLTGSTPTGGDGTTPLYQWQSRISGFLWSDISGANAINYQPLVLSEMTFFRRIVTRGPCGSQSSDSLTITVQPALSSNTISGDQTLCGSTASSMINGDPVTGGNGSPLYQWFFSTDNGTSWTNNGVITEDYSPGTVTQTTQYFRTVTSGSCTIADSSNTVSIVVVPAISNNTIGDPHSVCIGVQPDTLEGSTALGGVGPLLYSWQDSISGSSWGPAAGSLQAGNKFLPSPISENTWFRRIVSDGSCPSHTSNVLLITVQNTLANNSVSAPAPFCSNNTSMQVTGSTPTGGAGPGSYTYDWQKSLNDTVWTSSGITTIHFTLGTINSNTYFRRIVSSGACGTDTSNSVLVNVSKFIDTNTIQANQTICYNTVPAQLNGFVDPYPFGFLWEQSTNGGPFITAAGVSNVSNYQPGNLDSTTLYRRIMKSGVCPNDTSNTLSVTVIDTLSNNIIYEDSTVCYGATGIDLLGNIVSGGDVNNSYYWQFSLDGINYSTPTGGGPANTQGYTTGTLTQSIKYRRIAKSGFCANDSVVSNVITITVIPAISNNTIGSNQTLCGDYLADTLIGSNSGIGMTYQWQSKTTTGIWLDIAFANDSYYAPGTITDTFSFRRLVNSAMCFYDTSNVVDIIYLDIISGNDIFQNDTICFGDSTSIFGPLYSGGDNTFTTVWEEMSTTSGWGPASGTFDQLGYYTGPLSDTISFRRILSSNVCPTDTSNSVIVVVWDSISNNVIFDDTSVCYNSDPITLTGPGITGGSGNLAYLWEVSTDNLSFSSPATNFTSENYTTGNLTQTTYYRRKVTDINCPNDTVYSNVVQITVHAQITHSFSQIADTVCIGDDVTAVFQISGDAPYSIVYNQNGNTINSSNINPPGYELTITPTTSGLIILDSVYDVHGCSIAPADTFSYRVVAYPVVSLDEDTTVCESIVFNASHGNGTLSFVSPTIGTLSTNFPLYYASSNFGLHEFILTENLEGCTGTDTMNVTFTESVSNFSAGFDIEVILADSVYLEATDLLANETGLWTLISGAGQFADSTDPQTLFTGLLSGITSLEWTVTNGVCPAKSDQVNIIIRNLLVPTGFSPNNDGANDYLEFAGRDDILVINLQVYDRWGGLVFKDENYKNNWNGTSSKGEPLPEDTYFMIVDLGSKGITKSYLVIRR